jgi:hypothetical protein
MTGEMIQQYMDEQEGEPVLDDSRFQIDFSNTPLLLYEGSLVFSECAVGFALI